MAKKKKPDDEPIEATDPIDPIEPHAEAEPTDIVPDEDIVVDDITAEDDIVVEDIADVTAEDDIVVEDVEEDVVVDDATQDIVIDDIPDDDIAAVEASPDDTAAEQVVAEDVVDADASVTGYDDLIAEDDSVESADADIEVEDIEADDIDLSEVPDPATEGAVEVGADSLLDSEAGDAEIQAAGDFGGHDPDETVAGDYASVGDDFAASLGGDEGIELDAEPVEAGVTTLAPDAEGPIDSQMPAEPLKPATHWLTYVLIGLNFVAAPAFGYFMLQDHQRRQDYQHAIFQHDLANLGLPTTEEDKAIVAARLIVPKVKLSGKQVAEEVMRKRGVNFGSDPVAPIDEQFIRRIPASELTEVELKEHYDTYGAENLKFNGEPIRTVEQELQRLAKKTVDDIKEAANDTLPAGEKEQRAQIEKLLLPLAMNSVQVEKLNKKIADAQGPALKELSIEAAERRMAFNFLMPLEMFRPGDLKDFTLEQIGDLDALKTEAVLQRVNDRIASTLNEKYVGKLQLGEAWDRESRETVEKRLMASFTMLSLAYVKKPNGEKLDPKMLDRIPVIVGQYDAAMAATLFPAQINQLNERMLAAIQRGRDGEAVKKDDKEMRIQSFADRYEDLIQQIRFVQQDTQKSQRRLKDLEADKDRLTKLFDERKKTRETILASIETERARTAKLNGELRVLQQELFSFELRLATSEEELEGTNAEIRKMYRTTSSPKGGK
jgi:hypothetical protein